MKLVLWMVGCALLSCLAITALPAVESDLEVLLGVAAPLAAAALTWLMVERTYLSHPERLTGLMIVAFAAKMVFFGAYVTVMLAVLSVRPVPFMVSFTGYFIALYATEALYMRRLFGGQPPLAGSDA
jgi:hypothetical protein